MTRDEVISKRKMLKHFVVFLKEYDNCTAKIIDNYGLELFDECYQFDLHPGKYIRPSNYECTGKVTFNEKGLEYVKSIRDRIESGEIDPNN